MIDKKALKILLDDYWSSKGWKKNPEVSPDDFAYARSKGYMFPSKIMSHDAIVDWAINSFDQIDLSDIVNAFLYSLSTRKLEYRSALGSYAVNQHFPGHRHQGTFGCKVCGLSKRSEVDFNILNFERYKWGGVRHTNPQYAAFDLSQFLLLEKVEPNQVDFGIFRDILKVVIESNPKDRARHLEKRIAPIFESNKAEREILIEILGYCGILQPQGHPGFFDMYINYPDRTIPPVSKIDWTYPVCWWRGEDGVNQGCLSYYFPFA